VNNKISVDAGALSQVLNALIGPPHLIRELQVLASSPCFSPDSPIQKLIDEYNKQVHAPVRPGVTWTPASNPPDADTTVMLALADGEVWQGYWDGNLWVEVSGLQLAPGRVKYWQHTPTHPEDRA
jgi:hypothetical protein